ncbi:MAG: hypothetical protein QOG79_5685, partial [Mycobacterium sp.]|nr:hypothetical protein [Mycobacterium sp.]
MAFGKHKNMQDGETEGSPDTGDVAGNDDADGPFDV